MSVFDKIHELKHTLAGDQHEEKPSEQSGSGEDEHEGLVHKIKDALDISEERKKREEEEERLRIEKEREEARQNVETQRSWAGKLHDAVDGGKHKAELEETEFQRLEAQAQEERKKHESEIADKIRDAMDAPSDIHRKVHELTHRHEEVEQKEEKEEHHRTDKVKGLFRDAPPEEQVKQKEHHTIWKSRSSEEQSVRDEGWREKLRSLSGASQKEEKKKTERGWLMEKINEMSGGGAKSEETEDKLDKTIDWIQEHILDGGDQSNESALEQMKDEQISDTIRLAYYKVTGHDFRLKDKKH